MAKYSYPITVRARLLRLRRSQRELAEQLGYSQSYISMVLSQRCAAPKVRQQIEDLLQQWEAER